MKLSRVFDPQFQRAVVMISSNYPTMKELSVLSEEIKKDFPDTKDEDITVKHFGTPKYRTEYYGVVVKTDKAPKNYSVQEFF